MTRYTYDRRRDGRCEIRGKGEGVIARTDDHRQAERLITALNGMDAATSSLPFRHAEPEPGLQEGLVCLGERRAHQGGSGSS